MTALLTPALYRLRKVSGPVKLSQIGYVAAAFGVGLPVVAFDEGISARLAMGAVLIVRVYRCAVARKNM